ncbi:hypothetical protein VUR80DRAFT_639 [Thermomyces stellatus]
MSTPLTSQKTIHAYLLPHLSNNSALFSLFPATPLCPSSSVTLLVTASTSPSITPTLASTSSSTSLTCPYLLSPSTHPQSSPTALLAS